MKIEGTAQLVRIFLGESDRWKGQPLYVAIVEEMRKAGLAGATVFKGVLGFGAHSVVHAARIVDLSSDLPIVIELVDSEHLDPEELDGLDGIDRSDRYDRHDGGHAGSDRRGARPQIDRKQERRSGGRGGAGERRERHHDGHLRSGSFVRNGSRVDWRGRSGIHVWERGIDIAGGIR